LRPHLAAATPESRVRRALSAGVQAHLVALSTPTLRAVPSDETRQGRSLARRRDDRTLQTGNFMHLFGIPELPALAIAASLRNARHRLPAR